MERVGSFWSGDVGRSSGSAVGAEIAGPQANDLKYQPKKPHFDFESSDASTPNSGSPPASKSPETLPAYSDEGSASISGSSPSQNPETQLSVNVAKESLIDQLIGPKVMLRNGIILGSGGFILGEVGGAVVGGPALGVGMAGAPSA